MEAGIYSVADIHSFRNIHSTIIIHIYKKTEEHTLEIITREAKIITSKAKIPKWDKRACMRYNYEQRKVTALS